MKEAYINAKILDPEKSKEYLGDIIIEKTKIIKAKKKLLKYLLKKYLNSEFKNSIIKMGNR